MSAGRTFFRLAALLAGTCLLPVSASAPGSALPTSKPAWAKEFKFFDGSPKSLSYLVSQREYQTGTFLVQGFRPKDDRPTAGRPFFGKPPGSGDWTIEDDTGAICIRGVPPPDTGHLVVLAARFAGDAEPALQGIRMAAAGRRDGMNAIRVGEFMHFPLSSTKSASRYPELSGDIDSVESISFLEGFILRGVKPGTVTIKVFEQWWNRPAPEFVEAITLKITVP